MKKELDDLMRVYASSVRPDISIEDVKKHLVFADKKPKQRFRIPAILIAMLLCVMVIPIVLVHTINQDKPTPPEVLNPVYINQNTKVLRYVKNHFTYYLNHSIKRIRIDKDTILTLYYALEDDYQYIIYEVEQTKEKAFSLSFENLIDDSLLKASPYQIEHFLIPLSAMDIKITYKDEVQTKIMTVSIKI